jgi:hypothetical protein
MKKIGDLMQEMGFRKDAPDSVKEAFIKHLIKSATGVEVQTPSEKKAAQAEALQAKAVATPTHSAKKTSTEPAQLVFPFFQDQSQKKEKVS